MNSSRAKRTLTKLLSAKWAVLLVVAAVLLFFGRVTDARSLSHTAIVTGLGIAAGEDGFAVSAELAVMTSEAGGSPSANYAVLTEKGATVSEAVERISQKAGLIVSLSHCNVLVLTKEALLAEGERLFAPLVQTYSLPEQAILTATTGDPADILSVLLYPATVVRRAEHGRDAARLGQGLCGAAALPFRLRVPARRRGKRGGASA